jgi:hypothetical protein
MGRCIGSLQQQTPQLKRKILVRALIEAL